MLYVRAHADPYALIAHHVSRPRQLRTCMAACIGYRIRNMTAVSRESSSNADGGRRPVPLNQTVSAQMSRMPRARTGPEMLIRRELHRRGLRFRVNHRDLPGRPDVAFTRVKLAVFIDGCFWHMCPQHASMPKNNADWWRTKLERNVARDREKDALLADVGWEVVHVWEHEGPMAVADAIEKRWRELCAEIDASSTLQ
jgi:DNA mismatch endonuclease (patch repair protein)